MNIHTTKNINEINKCNIIIPEQNGKDTIIIYTLQHLFKKLKK